MRCLHCGKRLSLLRKFSDGEFCSAEHRHLFQQQQSDLALARLIEAQNRIQLTRFSKKAGPQPVEKPKGAAAAESVFPEAPILVEWPKALRPRLIHCPSLMYELTGTEHYDPLFNRNISPKGFEAAGSVPIVDPVASPAAEHTGAAQPLFETGQVAPEPSLVRSHSDALPMAAVVAVGTKQASSPLQVSLPVASALLAGAAARVPVSGLTSTFAAAHAVPQAEQDTFVETLLPDSEPECGLVGLRLLPVQRRSAIAYPECAVAILPRVAIPQSRAEGPRGIRRSKALWRLTLAKALNAAAAGQPLQPACEAELVAAGTAVPTGLSLRLNEPELAFGRQSALHGIAAKAAAVISADPVLMPEIAASDAGLPKLSAMLDGGQLLTVEGLERITSKLASAAWQPAPGQLPASIPFVESEALTGGTLSVGLKVNAPDWLSTARAAAPVEAAAAEPAVQPAPVSVQPAPVQAKPSRGKAAAPVQHPAPAQPAAAAETSVEERGIPALLPRQIPLMFGRPIPGERKHVTESVQSLEDVWADSLCAQPMQPASRLTVDHADGSGSRQGAKSLRKLRSKNFLSLGKRLPGARFWAHAPSDLKWVAIGLPMILALVLYSFRSTPPKGDVGQQVAGSSSKTVLGTQFASIQKVILERAAIKLFDDFRGGLGSWQGDEGWSKTWKYGEASFLEPGQLALYSPTLKMTDYSLQFLGQIQKRSLNWVVRASDADNYYVVRIVIKKGGPMPEASIIHYAVINGKEQPPSTLPIPFPVRNDTLYHVRMDVSGEDFTTYIQGQLVDHFSDSRLKHGGVGFYSPKGDRSLLRWVEVMHQYDYLGRLCALLAPYDVQADGRRAD